MAKPKQDNLRRGKRKMPEKRSMDSRQKKWPRASHQKVRERQWINTNNRNGQQQEMDEQTTSSATTKEEAKENSSIDGDEFMDNEGIGENEPMKMEEEDVEELEILTPANVDGNAQKKPQFEELVHTRQLLEDVLCPWEKIQQFIKLCPNDYWMLTSDCSVKKCLVAFRVKGRDAELVYIDQIEELFQCTIRFDYYGAFDIDTIQPHYGPIDDEDYGNWLDHLITSGEELPNTVAKFEAKKQFVNFLNGLNSASICERPQQNHKMPFDGKVEQIDEQILEPLPLGMDIYHGVAVLGAFTEIL